MALADSASGEGSLSGSLMAVSFAVSSLGGRAPGSPFLYKSPNPIHEGSILRTYAPPEGPTSKHHLTGL